jgi:cyclopropane-fatty-acyl-phospholipid synthase
MRRMIARPPRHISSRRAAIVLRRVFDQVPTGFAFQLWDGTLVSLGDGAPVCTVVVHRPETFIRLMRDPSPFNFAEAYVEGALDIEGDLFAAMNVANAMEEIRLSWRDRLRLFVALWRD